MSEYNKSYRIRTKIGVTKDSPVEDKYLTVKLTDKIDTIDIMSLKIKQENSYKFHCSDYGVVVGRAIANGGFGVPNVKVSVFISATEATKNDAIYNAIYPYERVTQKNQDNIRYNLLPDAADDDCYQVVGTFPNKRLVLDDDNYLEIYDNYYKFTTRTNNAGDYMLFGIPTGGQILHFDADLSDVGVLSQKPRDMIYKGYNINQFENANQFKVDDNLANLPQIISQDDSVYIYPFWGDEDENIIGITRHDIDINYKFEPTCVFIGSMVTDTNSNHISKKCIPTAQMGMMEELVTGSGTIEMIRKKQNGDVEQFNIQGTQLINDNGVWCYQIPMNLDYCMTDEYGNLVPSNDPTKGIATRAKVRFRFSMNEFENDTLNSFRTKVLVPNNPQNSLYEPDYVFGSFTEEESFRDLLWNNVYTVKSFIPRFQKGNGNRNRRFSGIKQCNYYGQNNPIPYNNMRINLSFQFVITCLIVRLLVWLVGVYNAFITALANVFCKFINSAVVRTATNWMDRLDNWKGNNWLGRVAVYAIKFIISPITAILKVIRAIGNYFRRMVQSMSCIYLDGSMCDALEGSWFFAPNCGTKKTFESNPNFYVWKNMMGRIEGKKMDQIDYSSAGSKTGGGMVDKQSIDESNSDGINDEEGQIKIVLEDATTGDTAATYNYVISRGVNYFIQCIEISLAQEFRVVQFDFYNDWINGMVYVPRWERNLRRKRKYFLFGKTRVEVRACNDTYTKRFFERKNNLTEQCGVSYKAKTSDNSIGSKVGCKNNKKYKCHKKHGRKQFRIFNDGGVVHSELTASGLYAYYFRPCEYVTDRNQMKNKKVNLFATDIVLLGSLVECDLNGTPLFTNELTSTSYQLPSPLAHTDSTEEGFTYYGSSTEKNLLTDPERFVGVFDVSETLLNPQDDGSVTEESGIDWGYTGPGQGEPKKASTYTPGGHFLGISCVSAESNIKSCVNLKRICEVNVWPSQRQEVFNGYDGEKNPSYVDIVPNGLIARDDIAEGDFRKLFSTMNKNGLKTRINESGFTVYDFEYMTPENFGGELSKYSKGNYNDPNPIENMEGYFAKLGDKNDYGEEWTEAESESDKLSVKPIRRSLDSRDSDYMRFRLGIDNDTNSEIQKKYLGKDDYGFYMPVYNNSFYFYFGLKPGATALDEFHKQFFAECKHTMSTTDLRLEIELRYNSLGITNAFDEPVVISIFDTAVTFNPSVDELRIYSTSLPIKIVVDGDPDKTAIMKDDSDVGKVYVSFSEDYFSFEIGRHTVTVTDSNGRSVTKLVEVVQQKINFCPKITPIDFSNEIYIINSTKSLVEGTAPSRNSLGGWFLFEWGDEPCEGCEGTTNPIFSYQTNVGDTAMTCVSATECTLLFVGRSHIIRYNNWGGRPITSYEEFNGYSQNNIYTGTRGSNGFSIYAGEEGNYSLYVLYKTARGETMPILIDDNVYIGEPDAIDFDVFREVIESEDDSPITFRNPLIKIWYYHPNNWDWYNYIYENGELTDTQKWYVRKNSFFIYTGYKDGYNSEEDMSEYFPSVRDMYVNLYYPSTVGNVSCRINTNVTSVFHVDNVFPSNLMKRYDISITGRTEDGRTLQTPPINGGIFSFYVFYKPYYYQAVIWEGYAIRDISEKAGHGCAYGTIYNGVVIDSGADQYFGPTVVNDTYRFDVAVSPLTRDFLPSVTRMTPIEYENTERLFNDASNKLLITEGYPTDYEGAYAPAEYFIETPTIGIASNWYVDLVVDTTSSTPTVTFFLGFENCEYEKLNIYWGSEKPLSQPQTQIDAVTIVPEDLLLLTGYDALITTSATSTDVGYVPIPLRPLDASGYGEVKDGTLLLESITTDKIQFSSLETDLGFLSSRCFIRNGYKFNYSVGDDRKEVIILIGMGDENNIENLYQQIHQGGISSIAEFIAGLIVIRKIYVKVPFTNASFRKHFGTRYEEVTVILDGEEYNLVEDFGYNFEYRSGNLVVELGQVNEDGLVDTNSLITDRFTQKIMSLIAESLSENMSNPSLDITMTVRIKSVALGETVEGSHNNTIDNAYLVYEAKLVPTNEVPEPEPEEPEDEEGDENEP